MSGSTSVAPCVPARAEVRLQTIASRSGCFKGGSDVGVADVAAGRVTIGNSSRDPKPSDPGGLVFHKIATRRALRDHQQRQPAAAHRARTASRRSSAAASAIGTTFPARPRNDTIDVVRADRGSGTQDAFQKIFLGSHEGLARRKQQASNGLIQQRVNDDKERDRLRLPGLRQAASTRTPTRESRARCERQVRPVPRHA